MVILWILTVILLLILFSGIYVFFQACVRHKELPWMNEEVIKKTGYARFYQTILSSDEWLKKHKAQDVYIHSNDGLKLHAYWIPAENPIGTILLAHGYRSTYLVDFGLAFPFYHGLGMNILVPSQRSHGLSEGRYITFGVKESEDMRCWIEYHNENYGMHQMVLSGLSMGASTMLYLADQVLPCNVKCIIADCGFTSPKAILDVVFRSVVHLYSGPTLFVADVMAQIFAGFHLKEKDTVRVLEKAKLPVLMIHGAADDYVPCSMTQLGFEACRGEKELLIVDGAGHGVSCLVDRLTYKNRILSFLGKYVEDFDELRSNKEL